MPLPTVTFENLSATAQTNVPQTFAYVFSRGDVPGGSPLALKAPDGSIIPCQVNVLATYTDGTVKHASLSVILPTLAGSASVKFSIVVGTAHPTGAAPVPADFTGLNAVFTISDNGTDGMGPNEGTTYTADAGPLLAAGTYRVYRTGPIASEWILRVPLKTSAGVEHPDLHARFEILAYKGQSRARIHCTIENAWIKTLATPVNNSPFGNASTAPVIYSYALKIGNVVVDQRSFSGFAKFRTIANPAGTYVGQTALIPNDGTLYTAVIVVDGIVKNVSLPGSAIQNYGALYSALTAQLGGLATASIDEGNQGVRIVSKTTGTNSIVRIADYGTLFPALSWTGFANNGTTYTATVTVNGTAYPVSVIGSQTRSIAQLCAQLNAQLAGVAVATPQFASPGVKIVDATTGKSDNIVITEGTIFSSTKNQVISPIRPFRGDEYLHHPRTGWTKTFWWGVEPAVHIRHDRTYMAASKSVPNYDPTVTGSAATIASRLSELKANGDIGRNGITKAAMPGPGGAPGIGILPEWQAMYVVNQGKDAKDTMIKMGMLMQSWPVLFRDYTTDQILSLAKWPYATISPNTGDSKNPATGLYEKLPPTYTPSTVPGNPNNADIAHHPDFNYVPYLVTGDNCHMEWLIAYYTYICVSLNAHPSYRDGAKCLWRAESQVRGKAWSIRTSAHAGFLVPDGHPKKAEIEYVIAQNVPSLIDKYVNPASPDYNIFGSFGAFIYESNLGAASFQEEFVTQAVGRAIELGYTQYMPLMMYKAKHVTGRLASGPAFCWRLATEYTLLYRATNGGPLYTSWGEVFQATFAAKNPAVLKAACASPEMDAAIGQPAGAMVGYPDTTQGYPANMQPAVAYSATYNAPKAADSWLIFDSRTKKPDYNTGPQFAIVPYGVVDDPLTVQVFRAGAAGIGGAISTVVSASAIFDNVAPAESAQGAVDYRIEYVRNTHASKTLYGAVLWLSANTPSPSTTIEVGRGTSAVNGVEQTLATETTAPVGVTFSAANSKATGVFLGDLAPGAWRAVVYRRTTSLGAQALQADTFTRTIEGTVE